LTGLSLYFGHLIYLSIWAALALLVSIVTRSRGLALGVLLAAWVLTVLVVPRIGVTSASAALPTQGKIITDMRMNDDLRKLGDGHDAADPAFAKLKANLLAQYDVDTVEELPVNFRGVVSTKNEADQAETLNEYAEKRMQREQAQAAHLSGYGWLSPYLAISGVSRNLAGTDLNTHHRFLREAEALRFEFVQGLNKAHVEKLSYADDMNRNKGEEGWRRARVDAQNWQVLKDFKFLPDPPRQRLSRTSSGFLPLGMWLLGLLGLGALASRRLSP